MLLAPYCMELLADEMVTGHRPELLRPFDPDRFVRRDLSGALCYPGALCPVGEGSAAPAPAPAASPCRAKKESCS